MRDSRYLVHGRAKKRRDRPVSHELASTRFKQQRHQRRRVLYAVASATPPLIGTSHGSPASRSSRSIRQTESKCASTFGSVLAWFMSPSNSDQRKSVSRL